MTCRHCGYRASDSKHCPGCGKPQDALSPGEADEKQAVHALGVLFVAVVGLALYLSRDGEPAPVPGSPSEPRAIIKEAAACTPKASDFHLLASAMVHQDRAALSSLVDQGRVLLLDGGTRVSVLADKLSGGRSHIYIESGEHIGKSCDILERQLAR